MSLFFCAGKTHFCMKVLRLTSLIAYTEEKSLRYLAMVAKFLDERHLKGKFALFQTSSILFNFIKFVKFSGAKSERTVSKFRKGKRTFLCCFHVLHKAGA